MSRTVLISESGYHFFLGNDRKLTILWQEIHSYDLKSIIHGWIVHAYLAKVE